MKNIAIIGVGGLGSRHLQSLAGMQEDSIIQVVDPSDTSIEKAKELFYSMQPADILTLQRVEAIQDLRDDLDVVIVATSSMPRRAIVEELLEKKRVRFLILEKVLFPRVDDYAAVQKVLEKSDCRAWVNHPRRMNPLYSELVDAFQSCETFTVDISGGNWGLGCNTVHFIDLIGQLDGTAATPVIDASGLDDEIIPSKRKGYIEFTGRLEGSMGRCRHFSIVSAAGEPYPARIVVLSDNVTAMISESQDHAIIARADRSWRPEERKIHGKYQSELTLGLVEGLLSTGTCALPDYATAMCEHIPFVKALLEFLSEKKGDRVELCPIT